MTTLTVGTGQQHTTISAAVAASASGDTINVSAGTYTNDFLRISHSLTIQGVGGAVNLVATVAPTNGKAIITEGAAGISVTLSGLTLSGGKVADGNGAGVRYEGGALRMTNMTVTGNQDGLLGGADSAGSITIDHSTFTRNGAGDGYTHNIYAGAINSLAVTNSTISDAIVGHDIKSRAANTTITNNVITDTNGSASYEIDLPNGGNAVISGNTIQKSANAQNPIAISYGEEGNLYAGGSLSVTNNLMVNDETAHQTTAIRNATSVAATASGNTFYGWKSLASGSVALANNVVATTRPALTTPATPTAPTPTAPTADATLGNGPDKIVLKVSEDAWNGDAQFTVSVDGKQYGGTLTATASHAAGQSQTVTLLGSFGTGPHTVGVTFLNDAYGGTTATDRNLHVDSIVDGTTLTKGATLLSSGTQTFIVGNPSVVTVGSGPSKMVLQMSEDAYQGDAQFTVNVDGQQIGGTLTATALHSTGVPQEFDILGSFTVGSHNVAINFLNDAYAGTASTDRNLYVDAVGSSNVHAALYSAGTQTFTGVAVKAS